MAAPAKFGPEFHVNTNIGSYQAESASAGWANGTVVWPENAAYALAASRCRSPAIRSSATRHGAKP
jgi:hypothetical protein